MTAIWLSPGLSPDRDALATLLGPTHQLLPPSDRPPSGSVAVVTAADRELVDAFASRPPDVALLLVTPVGASAPDIADLITTSAPAGWTSPPASGGRNRNQILAAAVVGVALLIAAIIVVTSGSGTSTAAATSADGGAAATGALPGEGAAGGFGGAQGGEGAVRGEGAPSGEGGPGAGGAGQPTMSAAQLTKLVTCLKENGVTVSGNGTTLPRLDPTNAAQAKALRACSSTAGLTGQPG